MIAVNDGTSSAAHSIDALCLGRDWIPVFTGMTTGADLRGYALFRATVISGVGTFRRSKRSSRLFRLRRWMC